MFFKTSMSLAAHFDYFWNKYIQAFIESRPYYLQKNMTILPCRLLEKYLYFQLRLFMAISWRDIQHYLCHIMSMCLIGNHQFLVFRCNAKDCVPCYIETNLLYPEGNCIFENSKSLNHNIWYLLLRCHLMIAEALNTTQLIPLLHNDEANNKWCFFSRE